MLMFGLLLLVFNYVSFYFSFSGLSLVDLEDNYYASANKPPVVNVPPDCTWITHTSLVSYTSSHN